MEDDSSVNPARATKKKINFVERNKLISIARKENKSAKENVVPKTVTTGSQPVKSVSGLSENIRPKTATTRKKVNIQNKTATTGSTQSLKNVSGQSKDEKTRRRPVTAPQNIRNGVQKVAQRNVRRQFENDSDIVSQMAARNLHHLLSGIFLSLTSRDLTACRYVCTDWYKYLKLVFWRDQVVRRQLCQRLSEHWQTKQFHQVSLVVSGQSCKKKCEQNYRDCHCKEKLQCQVNGTRLVAEFGGSHLFGRYLGLYKGKAKDVVDHRFDSDQFQISLNMKQDLLLETGNWLNTPVFMENKMKRTQQGEIVVEVSPGDPTYILIKNRKSKEIELKFIPWTGSDLTRLKVEDLMVSSGRLAVLTGGKVFVYSISSLLKGANRNALLLSANDRPGDPEVHNMHLQENLLLTVGGCRVTTYDFWNFDWDSSLRDFVV